MPIPKSARRQVQVRGSVDYAPEDIRMLRFIIPRGVIVAWHGLLAAIPQGWALCDGTNGTPDWREKFIKGAPASTDPGGTGGSATHTHTVSLTSGVPSRTVVAGLGAALAGDDLHTHAVSGTTAAGSSEPAYYYAAWLMKL